MPEIKTENVLGLRASVFSLSSLNRVLTNYINRKEQKIFYGYSLILLPKFKTCPEIYYYSIKFDIFVADGKGMYWIFKLAGVQLKSDTSLPDLVNIVLKLAEENRFSILLLGARDDVNILATKKIRLNYPNAIIFEGINGYFSNNEEKFIVDKINEYSPDILLVGISSPKKEKFVHEWRNKLNATIIIPCGGVIDLLAGKTKREPVVIKKSGLTWLYRFFQEPRRLFKPIFINGLRVIFFLIPVILFNLFIKRNKEFSIPRYYGIKI